MSTIMKQPGKPDAATLAERIKVAEREHAALVTAHDQAESEATVAAADESSYADASEKASAAQARVKESGERLDRLKRQYVTQFETEKSAFVADLRGRLERAIAAEIEGRCARAAEEEAENNRHAANLAEIARKHSEYLSTIQDIKTQLDWADRGVSRARAEEAIGLILNRRVLLDRLREYDYRVMTSLRTRINRLEYDITRETDNARREGLDSDLEKKREKLAKLEAEYGPIETECENLGKQISAIVAD